MEKEDKKEDPGEVIIGSYEPYSTTGGNLIIGSYEEYANGTGQVIIGSLFAPPPTNNISWIT